MLTDKETEILYRMRRECPRYYRDYSRFMVHCCFVRRGDTIPCPNQNFGYQEEDLKDCPYWVKLQFLYDVIFLP